MPDYPAGYPVSGKKNQIRPNPNFSSGERAVALVGGGVVRAPRALEGLRPPLQPRLHGRLETQVQGQKLLSKHNQS